MRMTRCEPGQSNRVQPRSWASPSATRICSESFIRLLKSTKRRLIKSSKSCLESSEEIERGEDYAFDCQLDQPVIPRCVERRIVHIRQDLQHAQRTGDHRRKPETARRADSG